MSAARKFARVLTTMPATVDLAVFGCLGHRTTALSRSELNSEHFNLFFSSIGRIVPSHMHEATNDAAPLEAAITATATTATKTSLQRRSPDVMMLPVKTIESAKHQKQRQEKQIADHALLLLSSGRAITPLLTQDPFYQPRPLAMRNTVSRGATRARLVFFRPSR